MVCPNIVIRPTHKEAAWFLQANMDAQLYKHAAVSRFGISVMTSLRWKGCGKLRTRLEERTRPATNFRAPLSSLTSRLLYIESTASAAAWRVHHRVNYLYHLGPNTPRIGGADIASRPIGKRKYGKHKYTCKCYLWSEWNSH